MNPVVAIVGRPNVGKSTLFNCFTKTRDALVSDVPGMTRDRQYGQAVYLDKPFIVIDTAGIGDDTEDLDKLSIQQSLQAIHESDFVLFVVDGRAGITPEDQTIANILRPLNKKVFLVVNKAEGKEEALIIADFFGLGFGQPHAIAASHRAGLDDLLDAVLADIPAKIESEEEEEDGVIKLAIIGKPNVGKSTLTNRMLGEERVIVFDQPGTTRDSIMIPLERMGKQYLLIDTAGLRRRGKIFETTEKFSVVKSLQAISDTHVVLFVVDAREGISDQDMRLLGFIIENGKALVIAINKWDGMSDEDRETTKRGIDRRLGFVDFARIHYISALHGSGVGNLFTSIDESYDSAMRKMSTSNINKILRTAVEGHNPPMIQGRRVKLRYAHTGGHNPPLIIIHGNQVEELPDFYTRYLENTFQEKLKLHGTPVKIQYLNSENPYRDKPRSITNLDKRKKRKIIKQNSRLKKRTT